MRGNNSHEKGSSTSGVGYGKKKTNGMRQDHQDHKQRSNITHYVLATYAQLRHRRARKRRELFMLTSSIDVVDSRYHI